MTRPAIAETEQAEDAGQQTALSQDDRGGTFDVLRVRPYRIILIGTILAFTAFNISITAQGILAFDLTGNNRAVGFVQFGQGLAMVLLNPMTGALVDRMSKRMLIVTAQTVIGITMLCIAILILTDTITILMLAAGSFIVGSAFSFNGPTRTALLGDLVEENSVGRAMALVQVGGNFARISGPFIAGAMLSIAFIGTGGTYLFVALIMGFVSLTMYQIPPTPVREDADRKGLLDDIREGLGYVRGNPRILHTLATFHLMTILGFTYFVLMPGFAKETLDAGNAGVGILMGSAAIGGLILSVIVVTMADSDRVPYIVSGSSLLFGVALIATGMAPNLTVAILTMMLVGAGSSAFQTLNNVLAARYSDHHHLGRIMALVFMAFGINSLVALPVGLLADQVGTRTVLSSSGVLVCIATVILAIWHQRIQSGERSSASA